MSDPDNTVILPAVNHDDLPERLWAYDSPPATGTSDSDEEPPASEISGGFTSLGYLRAALRRSARFWLAFGLVGFVIGCGLYVKFPPAYQASTQILLTNNPNEDAVAAMQTNVTLAESRPVAQAVIEKLGLKQSASSLLAAYTASVTTNQVLLISVSAPSADGAVQRAQTLATEFLQFRAGLLRHQNQLVLAALNTQVAQAQQHLNSINQRISQLTQETQSPARQSELNKLNTQRTNATNSIDTLRQTVTDNQATSETTTATMVQGSQVLDPATLNHHSRIKAAVEYVGAALLAGLAIGMAIVVIRALITDHLRRRDDIAEALGAPVGLSVGSPGSRRWRPGRAAGRDGDTERLAAYLRKAAPATSQGSAALAVVAVDNAKSVVGPLVSLAASYARDGKRVVLADVSADAAAARSLGVKTAGIHTVTANGAQLIVAVADHDDVAPVGPRRHNSRLAPLAQPDEALVSACDSADVLLTLITLDPALGGEHLATWASDVVIVVTAGQSSATRIGAVGEMVRLAGANSVSAVVIGADKGDESLGVTLAPKVPDPSARL